MKGFPKMALEFCQIVGESSENHFLNKKWSVYGDLIPQQNPGTLYLYQRIAILAKRLILFVKNLRNLSVCSMAVVLR